MSIIQEALKKAQDEYVEKKIPQAEEVVQPKTEIQAQPQKIKKMASMRLPALVSILTILLLVYGLRLSLQYSRTHTKTTTVPAVTAKTPDSFDPPKINPVNFILPHSSMFVLSGIMYMDNKPQAIINGNVLEEGDKINGATVLIIEKDCVLLDVNDANVRLELDKRR